MDQRTALSPNLRAAEQDTSVGPARKAEIARDFITKAAKSLEAQRGMLEEQTHTEVDEVEAEAAQVKEPTEAPAAPEGVHEVLLSLTKLPAGQRRVLSGKLREILKDTSIDRDERARVVSTLIRRWSHEDQSEVQVTDIEEELLGCEGSSVSEVGSSTRWTLMMERRTWRCWLHWRSNRNRSWQRIGIETSWPWRW